MHPPAIFPTTADSRDASADFSALVDAMRGELKRHCYRMTGGIQDAEDCVQETLMRGWREFAGLRDRTAVRPWLFSIATRVCLDALRSRRRRHILFGPSLDETEPGEDPWIEPWPGGDPSSDQERGQDIRLAFVSLLHTLSPRSRAVLLLHEGVGMTMGEAATALGITIAAARSALQRARAALPLLTTEPTDAGLADAYVEAWNAGNVEALVGLLSADIVLTMPPWHRTFLGRSELARFFGEVWPRYEKFLAVPLIANGQKAVALYAQREAGAFAAHSLHVLAGDGQLGEIVLYAPPLGAALFPAFGLPLSI